MFNVYAVCIPKKFANQISAKPHNLVISLNGVIYLEETTQEELDDFIYYLLREVDYKELDAFQDSIVSVGVDEIVKRNGKILIK